MVNYRYLGNSGFKISEITYGNWVTHASQVGDEAAIAGHGEGKAHFGEQGELVEQDGNHPGHGAGLLIVAGLRGECVDEFADEGRDLHGVVALKPGAGRQDMRHDVQGIVHGRLRDVPFMGQPGRDPYGPLRRRGIVAEFGTDDHVSGAHERQFAPVLMQVQIAPRTRFERVDSAARERW